MTTPEPVSLVFLYYDNPLMLRAQIECWNSYAGVVEPLPEVLLVDDGSPHTRAVDIVREAGCAIPIKVFRIKEDIPWNFSGARNLACTHATGWIFMSDIDTMMLVEEAEKFLHAQPLEPRFFYMPRRTWLLRKEKATHAIVNLLFHKEKYLAIGGYDEDYAGHYGREETDFYRRLKRVATQIYREDVLIRVIPPQMVSDARTITSRPRDKSRNAVVFGRKDHVHAWPRMVLIRSSTSVAEISRMHRCSCGHFSSRKQFRHGTSRQMIS
jgi:hypothetical protein